jgi:uncharacterized protein YcbK (DUF882 family)
MSNLKTKRQLGLQMLRHLSQRPHISMQNNDQLLPQTQNIDTYNPTSQAVKINRQMPIYVLPKSLPAFANKVLPKSLPAFANKVLYNPNSELKHNEFNIEFNSDEKMLNKERLANLISNINTKSKGIKKMQSNLPAKLLKLSQNTKPKSYVKSVSSTFSSVMNNGESHSQGKKIVNDSTKPYLQIDEMQDGNIEHYMIPKNTIQYQPNKFRKLTLRQLIKSKRTPNRTIKRTIKRTPKRTPKRITKRTPKRITKRTVKTPTHKAKTTKKPTIHKTKTPVYKSKPTTHKANIPVYNFE